MVSERNAGSFETEIRTRRFPVHRKSSDRSGSISFPARTISVLRFPCNGESTENGFIQIGIIPIIPRL